MLNEAHKYAFVRRTPSTSSSADLDGYLLLSNVEKFTNGALEQIKRVERARSAIQKAVRPEKGEFPATALRRLFMDAHFYFICVGQTNKFLKQLARFFNNSKLRELHRKFEHEFPKEIRNHLEHLDERVLGRHIEGKGRKLVSADPKTVKAWKQDFVNFLGDELSFGGKRYPVNAAAAKKLRSTYHKIIAIIREDYAMNDSGFIEDEMRRATLRKVMREVKKSWA